MEHGFSCAPSFCDILLLLLGLKLKKRNIYHEVVPSHDWRWSMSDTVTYARCTLVVSKGASDESVPCGSDAYRWLLQLGFAGILVLFTRYVLCLWLSCIMHISAAALTGSRV